MTIIRPTVIPFGGKMAWQARFKNALSLKLALSFAAAVVQWRA
jgi:hypothetical protein